MLGCRSAFLCWQLHHEPIQSLLPGRFRPGGEHAWESEMLNLIKTIAGLTIAESFVETSLERRQS